MNGTYVFPIKWAAGCPKCGADREFDSNPAAEQWALDHKCKGK